MRTSIHNTRLRNSRGAAQIAEFSSILIVVFLFLIFPFINLIGVGMSAATLLFLTTKCAERASVSSSFAEAMGNTESMARYITDSGFGKFAKLKPVGGANGCGADLYIAVTDIATGKPSLYGPNSPLGNTVDEQNFVYEYSVKSNFEIQPFINLGGVPGIGEIAGLGRPVTLSFACSRYVEHPDVLSPAQGIAGAGGGQQSGGATASGGATSGSGTGSSAVTMGGASAAGLGSGGGSSGTSGSSTNAAPPSSSQSGPIAIGGVGGSGPTGGTGGSASALGGVAISGSSGASTSLMGGAVTISASGVSAFGGTATNGGIAIGSGATADGRSLAIAGGSGGTASASGAGSVAVGGMGGAASSSASGGAGGNATASGGGMAIAGSGGSGGANGVAGGAGGDATSTGGTARATSGVSGDAGGAAGTSATSN